MRCSGEKRRRPSRPLLKILSGAPAGPMAELSSWPASASRLATPATTPSRRGHRSPSYQEFTLAPNMTIAEKRLSIGREGRGPRLFVSWRRMGGGDPPPSPAGSGLELEPFRAGSATSVSPSSRWSRSPGAAVDEIAAHRHGRADLGPELDKRSGKPVSGSSADLKGPHGARHHLRSPHRLDEVMDALRPPLSTVLARTAARWATGGGRRTSTVDGHHPG